MRLLLILWTIVFCEALLANDTPTLRVYTYSSFASEWGPGPSIKKEFESICKCHLKFITAADGNALLARLKIEKHSPKADVVIGIDSTATSAALSTGLFAPIGIQIEKVQTPSEIKINEHFLPYDFGYYAFMMDTTAKDSQGKPFTPPTSLDDLINNPAYLKSLIIQDPRSSAPGFALLLWIRAVYGDKAQEKYKLIKNKILTITKGWSESYKLFTKGEAPLVLSYTTSEAYHRTEENSDRYRAVIFKEGHYIAVEHAAILKSTKNLEIARSFLRYLISPTTQSIVASKNWMYPVVSTPNLPKAFAQLPVPSKILQINPDEIFQRRESWIREWQKTLSQK